MNRIKSAVNISARRFPGTVTAIAVGLLLGGAIAAGPTTQHIEPGVLPPLATTPANSTAPNLVAVPYRPYLDRARASREPVMLKSDGQHAMRPRQAIDIPLLAQVSDDLSAARELSAGPGMRIAIPNSASIPVSALAAKADTARPALSTDPTLDLAPATALTASPPPRSSSPPPLALTIPDPSRQPGALPAPPSASEDQPVTSLDRPSTAALVVVK